MWDSNAPLQLLQTMPKKLNKDNLEKLQLVIDADKYKNSLIIGFDLCGMYAPFCRGCNKTSIYPCALAYVKMMQAGGLDVEIDARPMAMQTESTVAEDSVDSVPAAEQFDSSYVAGTAYEQPAPQYENVANETVATVVQESVNVQAYADKDEYVDDSAQNVVPKAVPAEAEHFAHKENRKIRIAVARRKIL